MLIKIAARNLRRNFRRSLITILAIASGMAVLILSLTLRSGQYKQMIDSGVSQLAGHVVVQHKDFQEDREMEHFFEGRQGLYDELHSLHPNAIITTRMFISGLLTSPSSPSFVSLTAIDPQPESEISEFKSKLVEGSWLEGDRGILIGQNMANMLDVGLGDKVVFTFQANEEMNSRLFRVQGIFRTGAEEVDSFTGYIHYLAAEELLLQNDIAHQLALHLPKISMTDSVLEKTQSNLQSSDLQIMGWQEAVPFVVSMVSVDEKSNEFINGILLIIVAMGVLNTMLMSVMERTREFGVLLAIGLRPKRLFRLILVEGFLLGVVGSIFGVICGVLISYPLVKDGLDLTEMMGESAVIGGSVTSSHIYGLYDWARMGIYFICSIMLALLSAYFPARKINSMNPVDAMRHH